MIYMNNDSRIRVKEENVGDSIGLALKWKKKNIQLKLQSNKKRKPKFCACVSKGTWNAIDLENTDIGHGYFKKNYIEDFKIDRPSSIP